MKTQTFFILFLCFLFVSGETNPKDWFNSSGTPTFQCDIGKDNSTFEWFQVIYGYVVFSIQPSDAHYSVNNSSLVVKNDSLSDRDFFCEAKALDGRRWLSRKAQLRYNLDLESLRGSKPHSLTRLDTAETKRLFDGDNFHLTCKFSGKRKVQWLHNGIPIPKSDKLRRVDTMKGKTVLYILHFNSTTHSGVYQCMIDRQDSWNPLRTPFLSNPSEKSTTRPDLQFIDYEILTASELALNEDNEYSPRITLVRVLQVGEMQVTDVVVSDLDRGRGGFVKCNVRCNATSVPTFSIISMRKSPFVGSIKVKNWKDNNKLEFDLICKDDGKKPKTTKKSFIIEDNRESKMSKSSQKLMKLATESLKEKSINETLNFVEKLKDAMQNVSSFSEVDIVLASAKTAEVVEALNEKTAENAEKEKMIKTVTTLVSNTIKVDKKTMEKSEEVGHFASQTLTVVTSLVAAIPVNANSSSKSFTSEKLAVGAVALSEKNENREVITFSSTSNSPKDSKITNSTKESRAKIAISLLADQVMSDRVDFVMFREANLFQAIAKNNSTRTRVISPVIAARAVLKQNSNNSHQAPVSLFFNGDYLREGRDDNTARFCAFWNTRNRTWDKKGCESIIDGRTTWCNCSHLTNFALLLDLDAKPISRPHHLALSFLSYCCLTLSCTALAFTMYVYFTYMRRKRASLRSGNKTAGSAITRSQVMIAFCLSLFVAHLVFLVTAFHNYAGPRCKAIAVFLHFFYLSVFFWSTVEGVNIFLSVVYMALNSGRLVLNIAKFFPIAAAFAWISSAVIVVITAASNRLSAYGPLYEKVKDASDMSLCFLVDRLAFYLGFILPMVLCLAVNIVILSLLGFVLVRRSGGQSEKKKSRSRSKVFSFVAVCVTLNVTWIIGLMNFAAGKLVMNYLFVICNGLQGVFIFSCYCLLREEIRNHMANSIRCLSWIGRARDGGPGTTSQQTMSTMYRQKSSATSVALGDMRKMSSAGLKIKR